jgi:hypothetical protein
VIAELIQDGVFDDAATLAMVIAFDRACKSLPHPCHNAVREIIAKKIVEAAKKGERVPEKLRAQALRAVSIDEMTMPLVSIGHDAPVQAYARSRA